MSWLLAKAFSFLAPHAVHAVSSAFSTGRPMTDLSTGAPSTSIWDTIKTAGGNLLRDLGTNILGGIKEKIRNTMEEEGGLTNMYNRGLGGLLADGKAIVGTALNREVASNPNLSRIRDILSKLGENSSSMNAYDEESIEPPIIKRRRDD